MTFREKTTFVIGAGASNEFGLPVGSQLAALTKSATRTVQRRGIHNPNLSSFKRMRMNLTTGEFSSPTYE